MSTIKQRNKTPVEFEVTDAPIEETGYSQELRDGQRIASQVLYALLLASTIALGTAYGWFHLGTSANVTRARIPGSHQHLIEHPSYFADKRNLFNQVFVKKGWGWTTAAFVLLLSARPVYSVKTFLKPVMRYILATMYWLLFVSWFFGPSLSDRILLLTGAQCIPASNLESQSLSPEFTASMALAPELCMSGGRAVWKQQQAQGTHVLGEGIAGIKPSGTPFFHGGHDISGHTFILVHASLFLIAELAPLIPFIFGTEQQKQAVPAWKRYAIWAALGITLLWWWMLLMTSVYFHSPLEKLSGFLVGSFGALLAQFAVGT